MSHPARSLTRPEAVLGAAPQGASGGAAGGRLAGAEALTARVRMVLETRPGRMPWRPDFGCDLEGLAGQPATGATLQLARMRIEESLRRWVPDVEIRRVEVRFATSEGAGLGRSTPEVPAAEAALMKIGAQGWMDVRLDLVGELGPLRLNAAVRP